MPAAAHEANASRRRIAAARASRQEADGYQGSGALQVPKETKGPHFFPAALSTNVREVPAAVLSNWPVLRK